MSRPALVLESSARPDGCHLPETADTHHPNAKESKT
jgi:hypothetical protein